MSISYKEINSDRLWRACTGMSEAKFYQLSELFGREYESLKGVNIQDLAKNIDVELVLKDYNDCLFYVLYSLKTGLGYDVLGLNFGMSYSAAHKNFKRNLWILHQTLEVHGSLPKRSFANVEEFESYVKEHGVLIIDVSEEGIQRPQSNEVQEKYYSGKKKDIPLKS